MGGEPTHRSLIAASKSHISQQLDKRQNESCGSVLKKEEEAEEEDEREKGESPSVERGGPYSWHKVPYPSNIPHVEGTKEVKRN